MPLFVADASILGPGLIDPSSSARQLLILCAYSRLRYFGYEGRSEIEDNPEFQAGGHLAGKDFNELQEDARNRASALESRLPLGDCGEFFLGVSTPILDRLEDALRRDGPGRQLGLAPVLAEQLRVAAAAVATRAVTAQNVTPRGAWTTFRYVNEFLETAAILRAEFVVSNDPMVAALSGNTYPVPGTTQQINVRTLALFLSEWSCPHNEVDPSLLDLAIGLQAF
jgi:hypothetical protein